MINSSRYPVVAKKPLEPTRRRLFRAGLRQQDDLPHPQPGTALALQVGERFMVAPSAQAVLDGRHIAEASAAYVVALHRHAVGADVDLPSPWADMSFHLAATYDCLVTDVELLLQFGCSDVRLDLELHLADDPRTRMLAADAVARETTQTLLKAYALARNAISPPYLPGMTCDLVGLSVELRAAARPAPSEPEPLPEPEPADSDWYTPWPPDAPTGQPSQDYVWNG